MKIKLLEHYLTEAMAKSKTQHRKISAVLAEAMPEVVQELRRMVTAPDSDMASRKFAVEMLESFWRTVVTAEQRDTRIAVKRAHVRVRAKRVKVEETKANLELAAERSKIDRVLEHARKELESR